MSARHEKHVAEVLQRIASGPTDENAWGRLYQLLGPFVHAEILRQVGSPAVAEDLRQEVFLRLLRYPALGTRVTEPDAARKYLRKIARNVVYDWMARTALQETSELDESATRASSADTGELLSEAEAEEARTLLMEASRQKPFNDTDRELLDWLLEGRDPAQIAEASGEPPSVVYSRIFRLRTKLRAVLRRLGLVEPADEE